MQQTTPTTNRKIVYTRKQLVTWLQSRFPEIDFSEIEKELPALVWRHRWNQLADRHGLPYRKKYIQNLDAAGEGPASMAAA